MHIVILCGGHGTRLEDYSLPKPLNMIHGKPSIAYCLQNLPATITSLHFIASPHLAKYNFEEIIQNQFKQKKCHIHWIPYFTRGAIETALLGTSSFTDSSDSIVFLDNDVVYNFPDNFFIDRQTAFLGYAKDTTSTESYSFLVVNRDGYIIDYKEKKRISNNFCCGVYGFSTINQFRIAANYILNHTQTTTELYMSSLYTYFLEQEIPIKGIHFEGDVYHIGSLKELTTSWNRLQKPPMRVCFDLDNTLVTYPIIPGDYSSVKPIPRMIQLAQKMKAEGHTIIIHTARRMETHKHNIGAVIRDIGSITFKTLADFHIPYDEILFGKPIADMYIDDRAVNPYRESTASMGYLHIESDAPLNMLPVNKYNQIKLHENTIIKTGPSEFLKGEIFFYENIPKESVLTNYFPKLYYSIKGIQESKLVIEAIKGIPLYMLFKEQLVTEAHILQLFEFIDILHTIDSTTMPSILDMVDNYTTKLIKRFSHLSDYPFPDAASIQERCLADLSGYIPQGIGYIHGDLWFSNILVTFKNELKMIDMKGQVNSQLTTGGDRLYDYGKLYQSILGYDAALYNDILNKVYRQSIETIFIRELQKRSIDLQQLKAVTASLIIGTFHSIENNDTKIRIWTFLKNAFYY